jgi:hypothetical protein
MAQENKIYEFKSDLLKEFAKFPDNKMSARKFVSLRLRDLNKQYNLEKSPRKKLVLKKIMKFYEEVK